MGWGEGYISKAEVYTYNPLEFRVWRDIFQGEKEDQKLKQELSFYQGHIIS